MGVDIATRDWREKSWKKKDKATDARSNEINGAFKNVKTLKLYAWSNMFADRITQRRDKEEKLTWQAESKEMFNHFVHNSVGGIMTPTIITMAHLLGVPLSMSSVFLTCQLLDRI